MSTARTVARGTTRILGGLLAAKALDFFFYLFLARKLGVEDFGRYTFALSFALLFNIGADLGTTTIVMREAARHPWRIRALLGEALRVKGVLALVTVVTTLAVAWSSGSGHASLGLIAVFVTAMILNSTAFLFEGLLKAAGRAGAAGLSITAQSVSALAVGVALVVAGWGVLGGAGAYLCGALAHLGAAAWWSRDLWLRAPEAREDASDFREGGGTFALVREAAPLAISGAFIAIYFRIDAVLLKFFHGEAAVGFYGGAHRFFEGLVLISAAYRAVIYPIMARAADGTADALAVLCRKSLRLHLMFTVGIAVFFSFQAKTIVTFLLGPTYAPAAPALAVLIWALPGAFMADTLLHLLTALRRQTTVARALGVAAAFNVVLNLLLIPRFSFMGSAGVAVATEITSFGLMFMALGGAVPGIGLAGVARAPLIAGGVAAVTLALLSPWSPGGPVGLVLLGLFAVSAYALALIGMGAIGRSELELVRSLLPERLVARVSGERRG